MVCEEICMFGNLFYLLTIIKLRPKKKNSCWECDLHTSALIRAVISGDLCRSLLKEVANVNIAVLCSAEIALNTTKVLYKPLWPSRNTESASSPAVVHSPHLLPSHGLWSNQKGPQ